MPNILMEYAVCTFQRLTKQGKSALTQYTITEKDIKNMDIETIHSLYNSWEAVSVRLREEISARAKNV